MIPECRSARISLSTLQIFLELNRIQLPEIEIRSIVGFSILYFDVLSLCQSEALCEFILVISSPMSSQTLPDSSISFLAV
jgi:hypothetical protein